MTAIATIEPAYGSPEWTAERRNYIGASDVPAIMGLSPYGSAYDVWLQKRGLSTVDENAAMRWGHYHEGSIAAEYQRQFPDVTLETVGTLPHPKYSWLRATVDRLVTHPDGTVHPLEIKSTSEYLGKRWGQPGTDEVPDYVVVQTNVQFMVLEMSFGHAAVLVGHSDCRLPYLIERDRELEQMILDVTHDFHQRCVVGGEEPEITGPNTEAHLRRKYQTHTDVVRELDGDEAAIHAELMELFRTRKALEEQEEELKAKVMKLISGDYGVRSAAGKSLWYETKGRESIDAKGLIKALNVPAEVVAQFTKRGTPSRTFRNYPQGD